MTTMQAIIDARLQGFRPEVPIMLSLIGEVPTACPLVVIDDDQNIDRLDLRALTNLDVVIAHVGRRINRTVSLCDALIVAGARNVETWNPRTQSGVSVLFYREKIIMEVPPWD